MPKKDLGVQRTAESALQKADAKLEKDRLVRVTTDLIETITAPAFIEKMAIARKQADEGAGIEAAADLLSIDALREAGCEIPDDFRMTSRVFEDRIAGTQIVITDDLDPLGPLSWGACGGAGGLTFCGCGGFST